MSKDPDGFRSTRHNAYLRDLLEKLGAGWPHRRLEELMPDRWGQAHGIAPPPLVMTQIDEIG